MTWPPYECPATDGGPSANLQHWSAGPRHGQPSQTGNGARTYTGSVGLEAPDESIQQEPSAHAPMDENNIGRAVISEPSSQVFSNLEARDSRGVRQHHASAHAQRCDQNSEHVRWPTPDRREARDLVPSGFSTDGGRTDGEKKRSWKYRRV